MTNSITKKSSLLWEIKNFNHKVLLNITFGVPHIFVRAAKGKDGFAKKDGSYTELILPSGHDCQKKETMTLKILDLLAIFCRSNINLD